jgi:penicillin-binding protein 1C
MAPGFRRAVTLRRIAVTAIVLCVAIRLAPYAAPVRASDLISNSQAIEFTDRAGLPLGTILSRDQEHTATVGLSSVSPVFLHAIVSAEDGRYYERGPVDLAALSRAAWQAVQSHRVVSGGSTIPMQLARMIFGLPSTPAGKVEQIWGAWRIAAGMDRDRILEAYVNRLPMGGNVYGVEAAARTYLGVPASKLNLAQASLLAALPNDPTGMNPYDHFPALKGRQQYVLERMVANGYISREAAARASAEHVALAPRRQGIVAAPHFLFFAAQNVRAGTARVRTSIDLPLQVFVEEQVRQVMRDLSKRNVRDASVLVVDNATGQVLAYVGSPDYFNDAAAGRNDGVQALRQPGSTLKPFLYEQALETRAIRPNTILADVPVHYALPGNLLYSPTDYSSTYAGPVRVRIALANSLNVPAVRVLERVGVGAFLARLRELGFAHLDKSPDYYGLGLTLGGGEVSLWELARGYATMARDGRPLALATTMQSEEEASPTSEPVGSATEWELVTDILSDKHARARAFGVQSALSLPFQSAVKTGTSSDFRDTWTVGYTAEYTVAVWVGNFNGEPMRRVSGVAGAAPLWNRIMLHLYETREPQPFPPPYGLTLHPICSTTGMRPTSSCRSIVQEYFDPQDLAGYRSAPAATLGRNYDQWLALQPPEDAAPALRIVRPTDGSYFLYSKDGGIAGGPRLEFQAAGAGSKTVRWILNGSAIASSDWRTPFFWTLHPGTFTLVARSGATSDEVHFIVGSAADVGMRRGFTIREKM